MYRIFTVLLCVLVISACDSVTSPDEQQSQFTLKLSDWSIESIYDLEAQFTIKNTTLKEQTFGFSSGCQFGFTITKNDENLFNVRNFTFCTAALTSFTLEPKESKTFDVNLEYVGSYAKEALDSITKGSYEVNAFLLNEQSPEISESFIIE